MGTGSRDWGFKFHLNSGHSCSFLNTLNFDWLPLIKRVSMLDFVSVLGLNYHFPTKLDKEKLLVIKNLRREVLFCYVYWKEYQSKLRRSWINIIKAFLWADVLCFIAICYLSSKKVCSPNRISSPSGLLVTMACNSFSRSTWQSLLSHESRPETRRGNVSSILKRACWTWKTANDRSWS